MTVWHRLTLAGREIVWEVDLVAAERTQRWARQQPERLASEVAEMAEHFPRWVLVHSPRDGEGPVTCKACKGLIVPWEGAWRCITCRRAVTPQRGHALAWVGHLPAPWPDHPRLARRTSPPAGHAFAAAGGRRYLLAPLIVTYPESWPHSDPAVRYSAGLLEFLGLKASGRIHMYDPRRPCLYYTGQWRGVSVRAVLQQRVVNHLASLVKLAMGRTPEDAFIGRIHDQPWEGRSP